MNPRGSVITMKHDFTGKRFGKLVVIAATEERVRGAIIWRCRCDCGKEVLVESRRLQSGTQQSCGCAQPDFSGIRDISGYRFGKLIVLGRSGNRTKDRNPLWKCRCDCGKEIETTRSKLISGNMSSCGCGRTPELKDLPGKRFGRVVVLGYAGKKKGHQMWRCRCDCGKEFTANQSNLQNGQTTSCGCKQTERSGLHFVDGTFVEGIQSTKLSQANTSGFRGVYYNKKRNKWIAQIMFKRKCYYLGGFEKIEDAVKARARGEEMFDSFLDWYYGQRKEECEQLRKSEAEDKPGS